MRNLRRSFITLCSAICALMFVFSMVSVSATQGNTWTTKAPMATGRYLYQAALVNGKIYVIGGFNGSSALSSVEEYNPQTNTWTTKASMNTVRYAYKAAVLDGKIYAIGGLSNSNKLDSVEEYDSATNTWTTKAPMNNARYSHQIAVVGGKIYAIGGADSSDNYNSVEEYDPATDTWTTKAPMTTGRDNHQVAVVDGKIYAIGGQNSDGYLNSVEEYDPAKDIWTNKTSMATERVSSEVAVVDGKIYAIGGISNNSVEEYNPSTNTWTTKSSMTNARAYHQIAVVDGKIYAIGGYYLGAYNNSVEEYNPAINTWTIRAPMVKTRGNFQAALVNGKIYAIGGRNSTALNSLEEYTLEYSATVNNLTAIASNSQVNLSWVASEGATSYNIKRATTAGGSYTTIATSSAITYTDTTVVNGNTYYYVVSDVNSSNAESANSNEAVATLSNTEQMLEVVSIDKAKVGDEITANIVIHNAVNICAEDIKIAFDTSKLQFISAESADGIKIYKEDDLTEGIRRYITASLGKANAANGDKILLKLTFKAKSSGEAKIDITNGCIADNATLEKDIKEENCGEKIILIEGNVSDVNRSGEFTLLDLGIDAWYYGDSSADTDTSKYDADVVENGTIDDDDLAEIVKQMLNNSNYPASSNV